MKLSVQQLAALVQLRRQTLHAKAKNKTMPRHTSILRTYVKQVRKVF